MKKYVMMSLWVVVATLCGCTQKVGDVDEKAKDSSLDPKTEKLSQVMSSALEQFATQKQQVGYIMYNAKENEYFTCPEDEYQFLLACAKVVVRDDKDVLTRSEDDSLSWNSGGKGSSATDVASIAKNIQSQVPHERSFQIKTVEASDGKHFTVYWRLI